MIDAAPDELRAVAASEAEKALPSIEARAQQLEIEKREDGARRAAACTKELEAVCARYRCALDVEGEIAFGRKGVTRWPRVLVLALP